MSKEQDLFDSFKNNTQLSTTERPALPKGQAYGEGYIPMPSSELAARDVSQKDFDAFKEYNVDVRFPQNDWYEQLGQNQSAGEKIWNGTQRLVGTTVTKIGEGLGYVFSALPALLTGDISTMTDNAWSQTFSEFEKSIKDSRPIYTPKSVQEGGLLDKMGSLSFWMDDGVDGAAFLISALVPGLALTKGLKIGTKIAQAANAGSKLANGIDLATVTTWNTISESAFEAKSVQDNVRNQLQQKVLTGELKPEQVEELAARAARDTFWWNAGMLAVPNFFQSKAFFGKGTNKLVGKLTNASGEIIENPSSVLKFNLAKSIAKQSGLGFAREGLWEENVQTSIQNHYEDKYIKGIDKNAVADIFATMLSNTGEFLTGQGTEGATSILLGGIMGIAGGTGAGIRENVQDSYVVNKAYQLLQGNVKTYRDSLSNKVKEVYEKDETGNIKINELGKPIINKDKLAEVLANVAEDASLTDRKNIAILTGNKDEYDIISNLEFTKFALPWLSFDNGLEYINKQIDNLSEAELKDSAQVEGVISGKSISITQQRDNLKKKAQMMYTDLQNVQDKTGIWDFAENKAERKIFGEWLSGYQKSLVAKKSHLDLVREKYNEYNTELLLLSNQLPVMLTEDEKEKTDELKSKVEQYKSAFESLNKEYAKERTKEGALDKWNEDKGIFTTSKEDEKKDTPKTSQPNPEDTTTDNDEETSDTEDKPEPTPVIKKKAQVRGIGTWLDIEQAVKDDTGKHGYILSDGNWYPEDVLYLPKKQTEQELKENWKGKQTLNTTQIDLPFTAEREDSTGIHPKGTIERIRKALQVPNALDKLRIHLTKKVAVEGNIASGQQVNFEGEITKEHVVRGLNQTLDMIIELEDEQGYFDAMHMVHPDIYKTINEKSEIKNFKFTADNRQKAKELFHIWAGNNNEGKILRNLTDAELDQLIKAQENIDNITRVLLDAYASGIEYLNAQQLKDLGIEVTIKRGIFDIITDEDKRVRPELSNLEAAKIDGEFFIYDRGKERNTDVEALQLLGPDSNIRKGLQLLQQVSESSLNNFLNSKSGARYIAIGQKNNETFLFPLKRKPLNDQQFTDYIQKAKADMLVANTDEERNAVLNYLRDNIYFDTLPQKLVGDDGNPAEVNLVVDKQNPDKIQLRVIRMIDGKKETKYYPSKGGFSESELSTVESMITGLNRATGEFKLPVVITKDMVIDNTAKSDQTKETPTSELAKKFESNLSNHIFQDQKLIIKYNSGITDASLIDDTVPIVETSIEELKVVQDQKKTVGGLSKLELARKEKQLKDQLNKDLTDSTDIDIINKNISNIDGPKKVSDYITNDELNYEQAKVWIDKNLPSFIQVESLDNVLINIKTKGYTWGMFADKTIYLASKADKGTEAHEAFHAIFRLLLSDTEIQNYYRIARVKYANPNKEDLKRLKEQSTNLSNEQLEALFYEEKMADSFMEYKLKQDKISKFGIFGFLFKKIMDFFNWISGSQTELDALFGKINNGHFKNSSIKSNEFSRSTADPVYKLIPKGFKIDESNQKKFTTYHNTIESDKLIRTFAAKVYKRQLEEFKKEAESRDNNKLYTAKSKQQLIEEQFKVEAYFNDINNPGIESYILADDINMEINIERLNALNFSYSDPTSKKIITEEVSKILDYFNMKDEMDIMEELIEEEENERENTFDKNAINFGGIDSMTKAMRAYLGTITYHTQDFLGRDIEEAVDIKTVFSGLQRILSNTDQQDIIRKFKEFAKINPQAGAVYQRFTEDTGIDEDLVPFRSKALYRMFINTFQRERINYIQILLKNSKGSVIEANRKGAKFQLYEEWRKNFESSDIEYKKLASKVKTIETKLINYDIKGIQEILKDIGITVKDDYIRYLALKKQEGLNKEEEAFINAFSGIPIIDKNDLNGISASLDKGENIFERSSDELGTDDKSGAVGRILKIAEGAMYFDENAFDSNFQDANGETRYSYVKPSVTLESIRKYKDTLSNVEGRELFKSRTVFGLDKDFDLSHLQENYLLNHENANEIFSNLNVFYTGDIRENKQGKDGATFKDIDPRAFKVMQYMLFNDQKKVGKLNTALYYTRVLEAKSTAYAVRLPVESFYQNNQFTERGNEILYNQFLSEVKRIRNAQLELESDGKKIVDYHTGKGRGLKFFVFNFLNEDEYIKRARNGESFDDLKSEIIKKINTKFEQDINQELDNLTNLQLIDDKEKMFFYTLGIKDNKDYVGNFVLNGFVNSNALTDLLEFNQAMSKDHVDSVKRAGRMVAAKTNFGKGNHAVIVYNDPIVSSDKIIGGESGWEAEDAQASISLNHFLFINYREGRLDDKGLSILYDLNDGIKVSWEDLQYLKERGIMLNNLKTVTSGPMDYHKMSDRVLTRNLVMYKDSNGFWKPRKGREYLYNLYNSILKAEQELNNPEITAKLSSNQRLSIDEIDQLTPVRALPKTGSKLLNLELASNSDGIIVYNNNNIRIVPNKYSGRQVETPTGKTEITYGTQLIHLIDSEQDEEHIVKLPDGTERSLGDLRVMYEKLLSQARINSVNDLRKYLFKIIDDKITQKQEDKFRKKILDSLENSGADDNLLTFFGVDTKYNPNLPHLINKYEQIFFAHFTKGGFSQKTAGLKLTLFSGYGTNVIEAKENIKDTNIRKGTIIPSDYFEQLLSEGKITEDQIETRELQYNPTGLSEAIIPLFTKELYNLKVGDTLNYKDLFKLFGQRIPTQDKHSMAVIKIVDFLPAEYGSVIMMPKELVKLAGADFDIDSLFAMRKDFYTDDNGKLTEYGKSKSLESKWYEYKQHQIAHNKDLKKALKERLLNNKEYQITSGKFDTGYEDYTQKEIFDFILTGIDKDKAKTLYNQELLAAMQDLQLPHSFEEWKKVSENGDIELNNSVINNNLLDLNIQFLTNKAINDKQIPQTPVDTQSLKNVRDEVLGKKPKTIIPTLHSPVGQYFYWISNSTGKQNVGPAANYNIARAFLFKNRINLNLDAYKITIEDENNKRFELNTFNKINDIRSHRIQDSISTIVSAMTDNAKDPIAGDLHLTPDSLGVMLHWVSLGMDMSTAAKIINQPIVLDFIAATQSRNSAIDVSNGKYLSENDIINNILSKYQAKNLIGQDHIISIKELNKGLEEEKPDTNTQAKALAAYLNTREQVRYTMNLNRLMSLNKSLKPNSEDNFSILDSGNSLGLDVKDASTNTPFNIKKALEKSHISINYRLLKLVMNDSKEYIMSNTNKINSYVTKINNVTREFMRNKKDKLSDFKLNLLAHIAIQGYRKINPNINANQLVTGEKSLVKQLNQLIKDYPLIKDNAFIKYLFIEKKHDYSILSSNSRIKLSREQSNMITDSYSELLRSDVNEISVFAFNLFNYTLIKDGGRFVSDSYIKYLLPAVFKPMSDQLTNIHEAILNNNQDSEFYQKLDGLMSDYTDMYFAHPDNVNMLEQLSRDIEVKDQGISKVYYTSKPQVFPLYINDKGKTLKLIKYYDLEVSTEENPVHSVPSILSKSRVLTTKAQYIPLTVLDNNIFNIIPPTFFKNIQEYYDTFKDTKPEFTPKDGPNLIIDVIVTNPKTIDKNKLSDQKKKDNLADDITYLGDIDDIIKQAKINKKLDDNKGKKCE